MVNSNNSEERESKNKGILLLQMGGPSSLEEIQPFLFNLFSDKYIIQLPAFLKPFQKNLANFISKRRAPKVAEQYKEIGGKSPIKFETECQAKALEQKLNSINPNKGTKVYYAMRYTSPFLKETLSQMEEDNINDLTVIPLYPQYSLATSGSSMIECKEMFEAKSFNKKVNIKYIESWHNNDFFIQLIVTRILDKLNEFAQDGIVDPKKIMILFSAHGLPEKYVQNGDPYQEQVKESVKLVMARLPLYKHEISYQSKVGPVKWLEPSTDTAIVKIAKEKNIKNILVVPISFVGDHIETLFEIDVEYRHLAEEAGIKNFKVTRLPKANKLLIEALYSSIKESSLKT